MKLPICYLLKLFCYPFCTHYKDTEEKNTFLRLQSNQLSESFKNVSPLPKFSPMFCCMDINNSD